MSVRFDTINPRDFVGPWIITKQCSSLKMLTIHTWVLFHGAIDPRPHSSSFSLNGFIYLWSMTVLTYVALPRVGCWSPPQPWLATLSHVHLPDPLLLASRGNGKYWSQIRVRGLSSMNNNQNICCRGVLVGMHVWKRVVLIEYLTGKLAIVTVVILNEQHHVLRGHGYKKQVVVWEHNFNSPLESSYEFSEFVDQGQAQTGLSKA